MVKQEIFFKLTEKQQELLSKNFPFAKNYVHSHYLDTSLNVQNELLSYVLYKICLKIDNYDEKQGTFITFMANIMKYSLKNYYIRKMQGYHSTNKIENMTDDNIEKVEKLEKKYNQDMVRYKNGELSDKPILKIPQFWQQKIQVELIDNIVNHNEITFDNPKLSFEDEYDERYKSNMVLKVIGTFTPMKKTFCERVFYKGENPRTVVNEMNNQLIIEADKLRNIVIIDNQSSNNKTSNSIISTEIYYNIVNTGDNIDIIIDRLKLKDGAYMKKKIIKEIQFAIRGMK